MECNHYLFVSDDTLLNPCLDENNYADNLKLEQDTCFCLDMLALNQSLAQKTIKNVERFVKQFKPEVMGPITQALPNFEEAKQTIQNLGIDVSEFLTESYPYHYPFILGHNNVFVVDRDSVRRFCHLCGVFAAKYLPVEVAVPTALALASRKLKTLKDTTFIQKTTNNFLFSRKKTLKQLQASFPETDLYVSPIQLHC